MKRYAVAVALFGIFVAALVAASLYHAYRAVLNGHATGVGFVRGSAAENTFRLIILLLLAGLAYWLSGKLVSRN
jgi:hypothetical protein